MPDWENWTGSSNAKSTAEKVAASKASTLNKQLANCIFRVYKVPRSAPAFQLKAYAALASTLVQTWPKIHPDADKMKSRMQAAGEIARFEEWHELKRAFEVVTDVFGMGETYAERLHFLAVRTHGQREREAESEEEKPNVYELAAELSTVSTEEMHRLKMTDADLSNAAKYAGEDSFSVLIEKALRTGEEDAEWKKDLADPPVSLAEMLELIQDETFHPAGY